MTVILFGAPLLGRLNRWISTATRPARHEGLDRHHDRQGNAQMDGGAG